MRQCILEFPRHPGEPHNAPALRSWQERFDETARLWQSAAVHARGALEAQREKETIFRPHAERLAALLSSAMKQIDGILQLSLGAIAERGAAVAEGQIGDAIGKLLDDLHHLRDACGAARLAVLEEFGGLEMLPPNQLTDPQTGLLNRLGLAAVLQTWRRERGGQPWRLAVLDIDGFGHLNRRLGIAGGDRVLGAFAGLADDLLRKDRGFDRAGRGEGDGIVLFLGDTDAENAVSAGERIRQTFEASSFAWETEEVDLTISVGIACGGARDRLSEVLARAARAAVFVKEQGGNATGSFAERGPQIEPAQPYEVKGRRVTVDHPVD